MKEKRATLEVIAPTVEEAIQKGLDDLGLPLEAVDVEVLDQGSRGLFGLGSRQARIRLGVKSDQETEIPAEEFDEEFPASSPSTPSGSASMEASEQPAARAGAVAASIEEEHELSVAQETVNELLEKMKVRASVSSHFGQVDSERGRTPIMVEIRGNDLSILIGRRAETLNALQYITNLIVSKELGRSVSILIDVEGYRARREGQIRQLARRMADQAVKTGRRQVLEPMPANERRVVHMELRTNPHVTTESIGEEPRRKVTIIPKE